MPNMIMYIEASRSLHLTHPTTSGDANLKIKV